MDYLNITATEAYRLVGIVGFLAYVMTYAALSFRWVTGECTIYFAGNTIAASLVLISLMHDFNMASALIQVFWICIGVGAIWLRLCGTRRRTKVSAPANLASPPRVEPPLTRAKAPRSDPGQFSLCV
jgi:hypothetical protein